MNRGFDSIRVHLSPHRSVTFSQLMDAWSRHLARLEQEADLQAGDDRWGAHDFFAALSLRDALEHALEALPRNQAQVARDELAARDAVLRQFTEEDAAHLVRRFGERPTGDWWWDRVPISGLVREELAAWASAAGRSSAPDVDRD